MKIKNTKTRMMRAALYIVLIVLAFLMLVPFAWMLSASFKLDKDVFIFPIQWIPTNPRWQNYVDIWTRIPLLKFVLNTVKLTLIVTFLQLLTSSFAAYAFSKLNFKGKHVLFLAYIATIAVGVFMMKQFYEGIPTELCEAARIDGMSEYRIWYRVMLPLAKPALSTLTIFTFVNTWNDFLGPLIYLTTESKKTLQLGLRMFISQFGSEYGLIMAASVLSLIPVLIVFLSLQKYFVEGVAASGVKG